MNACRVKYNLCTVTVTCCSVFDQYSYVSRYVICKILHSSRIVKNSPEIQFYHKKSRWQKVVLFNDILRRIAKATQDYSTTTLGNRRRCQAVDSETVWPGSLHGKSIAKWLMLPRSPLPAPRGSPPRRPNGSKRSLLAIPLTHNRKAPSRRWPADFRCEPETFHGLFVGALRATWLARCWGG